LYHYHYHYQYPQQQQQQQQQFFFYCPIKLLFLMINWVLGKEREGW